MKENFWENFFENLGIPCDVVHPQHLLLYCTVFFRAAKLVGLNVLQLMNENTAG